KEIRAELKLLKLAPDEDVRVLQDFFGVGGVADLGQDEQKQPSLEFGEKLHELGGRHLIQRAGVFRRFVDVVEHVAANWSALCQLRFGSVQEKSFRDSSEASPQTGVGCSVFRNWRASSLVNESRFLPANFEKPVGKGEATLSLPVVARESI